jgi:TetR/AcrR family transcriptional regulator, transcriptional repressor for nem operon
MRDRRTHIIEAASAVMARQGYQQTSVDDVIKEAGLCGKAHFYHYFKSKEELGHAVLRHQFERFTERGLALLRDPMVEPLERLNLFIDTVVASQAERGCTGAGPCGMIAAEMVEMHEGFRQSVEVLFERWTAQLQALLWEARPQLKEDVDIARLARFIVATLEGALFMSRVKREITVLEGIAADLKRFVASHVRDGVTVSQGSDR